MKKKLVLMFICAITLLNLCGCGNNNVVAEDPIMIEKYNKAVNLMLEETSSPSGEFYKYDSAKDIFEELGDFRDSKAKLEECYNKSISSAIQVGESFINDGDIWGAKNWITYKFEDMPSEIKEFLQKEIFNLIGDWKFEAKGTSLRVDLSSQMGHLEILASNGSVYSTGYWKIKDNKLYFCDIIDDEDDDSNYKEVFTIVSYTQNTLVIKNSQQSFTLTK